MIEVCLEPGRKEAKYKDRAEKAIIVLSIVLPVIANAALIAWLLQKRRRCQILTQAKVCIQLSLAVASIFQAIFANITFAIVYYDAASMDCGLPVFASHLKENCIPLVYSCGLTILCINSILCSDPTFCIKLRLQKSVKYSVFCAILPWVFGLLASFPPLLRIQFEHHCYFTQSVTAEIVVQFVIGILPAISTILAGIIAWLFQECAPPNGDLKQRIDIYLSSENNLPAPFSTENILSLPVTASNGMPLQPTNINLRTTANNAPSEPTTENESPSQHIHVNSSPVTADSSTYMQPTANNSNGNRNISAFLEQQSSHYYHSISDTSESENYYSPIREPEKDYNSHIDGPESKHEDFPYDSPTILYSCIVFAIGTIPYHSFELFVIFNHQPIDDSHSLEYNVRGWELFFNFWFYWLFDAYHLVIPILWMAARAIDTFCYKLC